MTTLPCSSVGISPSCATNTWPSLNTVSSLMGSLPNVLNGAAPAPQEMSDACKGSVKDLFAPAASPNTPSQLGRAVPCAPRVHLDLATSRRLSLSSPEGEREQTRV